MVNPRLAFMETSESSKTNPGVGQSGGVSASEEPRLVDALRRFQHTPVDFVDAWLAASAAESGREVASFDRDLDRFGDVKRLAP